MDLHPNPLIITLASNPWQSDNEIVTIEIPDQIVKQWEGKPDFKSWHEDFLIKHPPAVTFKGKASTMESTAAGSSLITPKKRKLPVDISDSIIAIESFPEAEALLVEVPLVNARAGTKLTTMPILGVGEKSGPFVKNDTGHDAAWL